MHQYFDYFTLQTSGSRLIEKEQLKSFMSQNNDNHGLYFQQLLSWTLEEFQDEFPDVNFDNKLKNQLLTELLLQSLCFLSTSTSKHIGGKEEFWKSIPDAINNKLANNQEYLDNPYKAGNRTLDRFTEKLNLSMSLKAYLTMIRNSETKECEIPASIIPESSLSEYLFTHMLMSNIKSLAGTRPTSSTDEKKELDEKIRFLYAHALCLDTTYNPFEDIRNEETLSKKLKYLFKKEGKNFFAYLVQSVTGNIIVPYTTDALAGIPFNSLKSFWESTYNAYGYYHCQSSSRSDKLEDFLFLINAENIFHLTYTEKVFQKYNKIFYTLKENAVYGFETSLMLIRELQDCPLQTLSCALLDVNFDKYFERQSFPDVAQPEIYRDIYVSIMEKMTNYFYSLLLKSYGCIMSITENQDFTHTVIEENGREYTIRDVDIPESPRDVLENMEKLKQIILDYLMVNPDVNLSWSILRNKDKPDFEKIISDDFFNFCVSFALFAPPYEFNDLATMNRSEFDISKYLKYAMKQKDF